MPFKANIDRRNHTRGCFGSLCARPRDLIGSIINLIGLTLAVPDHSTLSLELTRFGGRLRGLGGSVFIVAYWACSCSVPCYSLNRDPDSDPIQPEQEPNLIAASAYPV
ncbi:MAG: hypothetical protein QOJ58_3846 [Alphaproteobacteria bacterium]|nr:hypothetical protein [Alphaproteobacteria bacterium]